MRILAIVNPAAGGGRAAARAERRLAGLEGVNVVYSRDPGHVRALAADAWADRVSLVIACGGDGTVFEVVNGLMAGPADGRPALGIVAVGTGNSFARDFGLQDPSAGVSAIRSERRRRVDVLNLSTDAGDLHAINLVSFGFSAVAGEITNQRFKGLGPIGYVSAVLVALASLRTVEIPFSVDGHDEEHGPLTMLSFCNSRFTGGAMEMAPGADPSDGQVDVVRIGPMGRRRLITSFPRIFRGTHVRMPEISTSRARQVVFGPHDRQPVLIDGEIRSLVVRTLSVIPSALELLA